MIKTWLIKGKTFFDQYNRGIVRTSLTLGVSSLIAQFLMMIYLVLVARWLGAQNYSYIAAVYAIASLTSFVFNGGLNEWLMTTGVKTDSPGKTGGNVILSKSILGFCWVVGLFVVLQYLNPELYLVEITVIVLMDVWFDSMFSSLLVILVLKDRSYLASALLGTSRFIRLLAGLFLISIGIESIILFSMTRFICTLMFFLMTWFWAKPIVTVKGFSTLWHLYRDSSAFNANEILNMINVYTEINLLSFMGADQALISNYSIAVGLINAFMILPLGVYTVLVSSLVRSYKNNVSEFFQKIRIVYIGFTILGLLMWGGVKYLGIPVIQFVMGESYYSSGNILNILSMVLLLKTINQGNISYLVTVGSQAKRLIPQTSVVILRVGLGIWAFFQWRIVGLIFSAVFSDLALLFGYSFQVIRHYFSNRKMVYR